MKRSNWTPRNYRNLLRHWNLWRNRAALETLWSDRPGRFKLQKRNLPGH